MRYLVSGSAGFVGSWMVETLCKEGHIVFGVDDMSGGSWENVEEVQKIVPSGSYKFIELDLNNHVVLTDLVMRERPEVIVHAAACAREGASAFQPRHIVETNIRATTSLLEACIPNGMKKFVMYSSMAVMGYGEVPFREDQPMAPVDPYGTMKMASEMIVEQLARVHGFQYTIIRPHNCFDEETEILTKDKGFIPFSQLTFSDQVATLNSDNNQFEWQIPTDIQKMPHSGPMCHFTPKGVDLLVTEDHHLWMRKTKNSPFSFHRADSITDTNYASEFMGGAPNWEGHRMYHKVLPECRDTLGRPDPRNIERIIPINSWVKFMGWFLSEGCVFATKANYVICISNRNMDNLNEIRETVESCGYSPYMNGEWDVRIFSKQLYNELIGMAGAKNKYIPDELKNLPKEQLSILFTSLLKGDGTFNSDGSPRGYKTISPKLASDIEEVATKLGYRTSHRLYVEPSMVNAQPCYLISFASKQNTPQLGDNYEKKVYLKKIHYEGMVYDCTVPNHVILVRRNGKVIWSGNCIGPRQSLCDPYRNVAGIVMNRIMRKEPLYLYGKGHTRAFSYVDDFLPAMVRACDLKTANGEIIFVGGKEAIEVEKLFEAILEDFQSTAKIIELPMRPLEVKDAHCSIEKSQKLLGYKEKVGWREGIKRMSEWAKKKGPQKWHTDYLPLINKSAPLPWQEFNKEQS